ncbi:MAG TPA: chemotaxis protein CheB [Puia sp.]|nr:chemotaxis protein CheB [Puia sp.]
MQGKNFTPSSQRKVLTQYEEADQFSSVKQISFPVVAIGAAAGGLNAIYHLLGHLPADLDMAFVVLLYTSAEEAKINIREVMQKRTSMKVMEAAHNIALEMNKVYILPMENYLSIDARRFVHLSLYGIHKDYHVIDHFFTTLATIFKNNAIAILLSGSGADGTAGIRAVRAEGGITMAQDETAMFRGMSQYAIESGYVDLILSPEGVAKELTALKNFTFRAGAILWHLEKSKVELSRLYSLLSERHAVDFSLYKQDTVNKHIIRRMTLNKMPSVEMYVRRLENDQGELDKLYKDLLSGTVGFFKEQMLGRILQKKIFPDLLKDRKPDDPVRIWIPACGGGEEACAVAIYLLEYMHAKGLQVPIQIFATDLNEATIEAARTGLYTRAAVQHISPLRLRKFFVRQEGGYRVIKLIRDMCIFALHNFLKDPPYARIDIISCQHVLLSLEHGARSKALQSFHYALKPTGFFLLDRNDSLSASEKFFIRASKEYNIYTRKPDMSNTSYDFLAANLYSEKKDKTPFPFGPTPEGSKVADKVMLTRYVPAGMLIDGNGQVLRFYGAMASYLRSQMGRATLEMFRIIHEDLVMALRLLIPQAATERVTVRRTGVPLKKEGMTISVNIDVVPIKQMEEGLLLIVIRERDLVVSGEREAAPAPSEQRHILELEDNLLEAGKQMRSMQEAFDRARQDLQAAHEELLSNNEELQSINEELQMSKEDLQAMNEELKMMNEEVIQRNAELKESMEYSDAIVETIRQPLLDMYSDLRIRKANKAFYQLFQLHIDEVEGNYLHDIAERLFDVPELLNGLRNTISRRMIFEDLELSIKMPLSGDRIILFNATRINGQPGKRSRLLLVLEDITERRLMEKKKDEFISIASHELKTPATSIQAYTRILYQEFMDANDTRNAQLVSKLNSQVHRLTSLTKDLLDTTRISQGQLCLQENHFDVRSMVAETVEEMQPTTNHPLLFVCVVSELIYWGDRERLIQVLQNLITNAIKYSSGDSRIIIELDGMQEKVVLRVRDFGMGMTPEVRERVFERFFRSRDPLTLRHPGLGLGLYISHQIVQQHGGEILIESEKGKGSVFTVVLPVRKAIPPVV